MTKDQEFFLKYDATLKNLAVDVFTYRHDKENDSFTIEYYTVPDGKHHYFVANTQQLMSNLYKQNLVDGCYKDADIQFTDEGIRVGRKVDTIVHTPNVYCEKCKSIHPVLQTVALTEFMASFSQYEWLKFLTAIHVVL